MKLLAAVAVSAMLMVAHQSTAPPDSHDSINTNAQIDAVVSHAGWSKVLNLDTSFADVSYVAQLEVIDSDDVFGMVPKGAVPEQGPGFGSTMSAYSAYTHNTVPYLYRGEACADARATFEDC